MRTRNAVLFCLVTLGFLVLAGCARVEVTTEIRGDGSGSTTIILALDTKQTQIVGSELSTALETQAQSARDAGASVEPWSEGDFKGYKMIYPFTTLDQMAATLTSESESMGQLFSQASAAVDDQNQVHFQATGDWGGQFDVGQQMKFTLIMPGKILSYSEPEAAQKTGSDRITWDLMKFTGRQAELSAVSEIGKARGFPWAAVVGGAVGLLLIVGLVIALARYRRKSGQGGGKMTCPVCGAGIEPGALFCLKCGSRLPSRPGPPS